MSGATVSAEERRRRKAAVDAYVAVHGMTCPGWAVPPHQAQRLEAAHVRPRGSGGEYGPVLVLCHPCNVRMRFKPNRLGAQGFVDRVWKGAGRKLQK